MVVDPSALIAVLKDEPDLETIVDQFQSADLAV